MWLASCRRQGILTQGPTPDPKCKLIISPFLSLPHLLDCLICTRNAMSIILLLQLMGDGLGGVWLIYIWVWVGNRGWVSSYSFFSVFLYVFVFCCLMFSVPSFRLLEHDGCCVCFFVFTLFSFSLVPLSSSH